MSKFKVGDKVVVVDNSNMNVKEKAGYSAPALFDIVEVVAAGPAGMVELEFSGSVAWSTCRFVHERDFTLACINHLLDKKVELEIFNNDCGDVFYKASLYGGTSSLLYRSTVMDVINTLYPTETPQQKKLRELEEHQRKIADEIKELRSSL